MKYEAKSCLIFPLLLRPCVRQVLASFNYDVTSVINKPAVTWLQVRSIRDNIQLIISGFSFNLTCTNGEDEQLNPNIG